MGEELWFLDDSNFLLHYESTVGVLVKGLISQQEVRQGSRTGC